MNGTDSQLIGRRMMALLCGGLAVLLSVSGCTGYQRVEAVDLAELEPVHDQWYVLRNTEDGERIGARHLEVRRNDRLLVIVEKMAVQRGNDAVAYRSEIRYARDDRLRPRSATVTTYLNGRPFMGGQASYEDGKLRMTAALADEDGTLQEPLRNAQYQVPPASRVAFLPGLAFLLGELRELGSDPEQLALVEFPADLDILAQLRPAEVLNVRSADGTAQYTVRDPESEEPMARWSVAADGSVENGIVFQTEFVPSSQKKALGTAETD